MHNMDLRCTKHTTRFHKKLLCTLRRKVRSTQGQSECINCAPDANLEKDLGLLHELGVTA